VKKLIAKQGRGDSAVKGEGLMCGVDCLYLFVKLRGVECSAPDVEGLVPIGEYGASLLGLREASERLGVRARVVRAAPENLAELPLPAVAHLEPRRQANRYNHYVLLVEVGPSVVKFFDPLDNRVEEMRLAQFADLSSGHFLVAQSRWFNPGAAALFVTAGLAFTGLGLWWRSGSRRKGDA